MNTTTPFTNPTAPTGPAPASRADVFLQTLWRAAIVCFAGGLLTALGSALALALAIVIPGGVLATSGLAGDQGPADLSHGLGVAMLALTLAVIYGLVLGLIPALLATIVGAPAVAAVSAGTLVPYRGARITRLVPALVLVALGELAAVLTIWVFFGPSPEAFGSPISTWYLAVIFGAPVLITAAIAWFGGRWTTKWYVRRMERRA